MLGKNKGTEVTVEMIEEATKRAAERGYTRPRVILTPENYKRAELMINAGYIKPWQAESDTIVQYYWMQSNKMEG